jgi:cation:H+ antiporter
VIHDLATDLIGGRGVGPPLAAFAAAGVLVFLVSSRLAHHADAIADATGLGRAWIGALLLAGSTSLPELITDLNATWLGAIDLGIGDLFGSTLANMLLLALLDLLYRRRNVLDTVSPDHALVGTVAILVTTIAGAAIASGGWGRIGHVGVETVIIVAVYLLGMRSVYLCSRPTAPPEQLVLGDTKRTVLRRGVAGFALGTAGLAVLAPALVLSAEVLAAESGTSSTFIGTLLVGFTTSFPEIAATLAAARLGAFDLAVGNILGSNAFNLCILFAMDLAYVRGPLLAHASRVHVLSALLGSLAIAFAVMGILARKGRAIDRVRFESIAILACYGGAVWLLARSVAR